MDAGELHWDRIRAGIYQTHFWANGYIYQIVKDDNYANTWRVYYRWHKWKRSKYLENGSLRWVHLVRGYSSSHDTLKRAKQVATFHNLQPREKYKFVGIVTEKDIGFSPAYMGFWKFRELDREGRISNNMYRTRFINPKEMIGEPQ